MKSLSFIAGIAVLCSVACKKIVPVNSASAQKAPANSSLLASTENLGNILRGTNVSWKINPQNPNNLSLLTYRPGTNTGFAALMIDNGHLNGAVPTQALRFISADLQTGTSKIITIKSKQTGAEVTKSVGRITNYTWGTNKKFYVGTEAAPDGGGHLIEYDPLTQTAYDLGQPFKLDGRYLSIYMLNVGSDGALYGGSFGGNGDVLTFRYNYTGNLQADKTSIDADAKYVAYVSGDANYTYASVGQDKWKLYAIERATGNKRVLLESNNPYERIEIASHTDAPYAKLIATHHRLNGFSRVSLGAYNTPSTKRSYFTPYEIDNANVPTTVWDGNEKKLYYKLPGAQERSMKIDGVIEDVYPTGTMVPFNNMLFINSAKTPLLASYSRDNGFRYIGSGLSIHCMAASSGAGGNVMYCGGYPRGFLMEYKINNTWTLDKPTTSFTPPDVASTQSNPRKILQFQDPDNQGIYGSMYLSCLLITKDGYMVGGGNNDRLTVSTNREISFGSYKNGVIRNFYLPEFQNYEFSSMCLSADSTNVYIAATHKYGGKGRIYTYNPATNTVKASIEVASGNSPGDIAIYRKNTVIGAYKNVVYMLDVTTNSVLWKKTLAAGEGIYTMTMAPDKSIWINHLYSNALTTRISKIVLKSTETGPVTDETTAIADIRDADNDETTKPSQMVFLASPQGNSYDLYVSGLRSLYRVNNCLVK